VKGKGAKGARGFTLIEVLVALMIVAIALAALMIAVSGTARTSGYLRDKTLAQWIALNRLTEVRLNLSKFGQNTDTGEVDFGNRKWHYDTRYFDTTMGTMKRVVVRVYLGDAKTKGNPIAETIGFLGTALSTPGGTVVDWTSGTGSSAAAATTPLTPITQTPGSAGIGAPITPTPVTPTPTYPTGR
jgi:general secretion pathway protein I